MDTEGLIRPHHTKLAALHKLMDAFLIVLGYAAIVQSPFIGWSDHDSLAVIVAAVIFYRFAKTSDLYRSWRIASLGQEAVSICASWVYTALSLLVIAGAFDVLYKYPASQIWLWALSMPLLIIGWHAASRLALRQLRKRGFNTRSVGIVGMNYLGTQLANGLAESPWMGFNLKGFYDDRGPVDGRLSYRGDNELLGGLKELIAKASAGEIDVIFIALPFQAEKRIAQFIDDLRDTTVSVYFAQDFRAFELLHGRSYVLGNVPLISVHESPFSGVSGVVKRVEDIVLSSLILALMALPALIIAIGVKLSSPGPIFFGQRRYGLDGRQITILKFRTMTVAEDGDVVPQTTKGDPRVTPFGRFLRRISLDEIPQFVNVLQGNMSIVGPRPHAVAHNEIYRRLVKSYMLRHKVKPGITGLAQINGWRGETATVGEMERRVECDLDYIRNWSLPLDLKIIASTVLGGFTGKKAY